MDHESGFHGYIHEAPNRLSREEEHYWMRRSIEIIEQHGAAPRGNRRHSTTSPSTPPSFSPGRAFSTIRPYGRRPALSVPHKGELVELPVGWATDDSRRVTRSASTTCSRSCRRTGRWRCSWPSSKPHWSARRCGSRSGILRQRPAVALAAHREDDRLHARHRRVPGCAARGHRGPRLGVRARGEYDIRVDRLPYYERPQLRTRYRRR